MVTQMLIIDLNALGFSVWEIERDFTRHYEILFYCYCIHLIRAGVRGRQPGQIQGGPKLRRDPHVHRGPPHQTKTRGLYKKKSLKSCLIKVVILLLLSSDYLTVDLYL